ncbi:MAG TPA: hypothetical protein VH395_05330, partial [Jatrophihabitantaceae bacterium]
MSSRRATSSVAMVVAERVAATDAGAAPSSTSGRTAGFALPVAKFAIPVARPELVFRTALVDRLAGATQQIISVVAPPGYGKTTLLAQWAAGFLPYLAWVSCDDGDNDPVVLLTAIASALSATGLIEEEVYASLAASGAGITFVPRFMAS